MNTNICRAERENWAGRTLNDKVSQNVATTFAHTSWDKTGLWMRIGNWGHRMAGAAV